MQTRIFIKKRFNATVVTIISLLFLSCNSLASSSPSNNPIVLSFPISPNNTYETLVKNERGEIIALVKSADSVWLLAKENDNFFTELSFEIEPKDNCTKTEYDIYQIMKDGKILTKKTCFTNEKSIASFALYNYDTNSLEEMVTNLPLGTIDLSWNSNQDKAIAYFSTFSNGTLFWLWKDSYEPLDLIIRDANQSWNLKDDFPSFAGAKEGRTGNVGRVDWSPNGNLIAFFASPNAIGVVGYERFEVQYKLYLMDSINLEPYPVLDDIYYPHIIRWSPDSKYIAFIGKVGMREQNGIWLYSLETKSVSLIVKGEFRTFLWRDNNSSIIALRCEDVLVCNQIEEFKLTE